MTIIRSTAFVKCFFIALFFTALLSCKKAATPAGENKSPNVDGKKATKHLVTKGFIKIKYGGSTFEFTAPKDSIFYTYLFTADYYSLTTASQGRKHISFSVPTPPETLKQGAPLSPFTFFDGQDSYMYTWDILEKGKFNITAFNTDDVLFKGDFTITVSKNYSIYSQAQRVIATGTVELYK